MTRVLFSALLAVALLAAGCGGDDPTTPDATPTQTSAAAPTPTTAATQADPTPSATATSAPTEPSETPSATPGPATSSPASEAATTVTYYLVRDDGTRPWLEPASTQAGGAGVARGALEALFSGPTPDGLTRPAPEGTAVNSVDIDPDGTLTVDLTLGEGGLGAAFEQALVDAIALTGGQFDTVDRVRILVDGAPAETLYGHVDVSGPIEPDPFAIAPIVVTSAEGVGGSGPGGGSIELSGTANTFEATIEIDLLDAGGNEIEQTFATATCGTGCRGDWSHAFTDLEPDRYTVVVRAPDPSDGEGDPPFERRVEVTVP